MKYSSQGFLSYYFTIVLYDFEANFYETENLREALPRYLDYVKKSLY